MDGTGRCAAVRDPAGISAGEAAAPELLAAALESAAAPALILSAQGRVVYANGAMVEMMGRARNAVVGQAVEDLLPDRGSPILSALRSVLGEGRRWSGEVSFYRRDGDLYQAEVSLTPVSGERQVGPPGHALALFHEAPEQLQSQARLLLTDRMVSVGTLAAGVAHEINNPLAFLLTNLNFAGERLSEMAGPGSAPPSAGSVAEVRAALAEAREGAERVRDIVRDLRTFSRGDDGARGLVDVERVLESSIKMAWNEIRHRARLVRNYARVPPVEAEEARLGQVFLNLLLNAVQAIPEGDAKGNEIRVSTRVDDQGRVVAEVRDSGGGVPEAVRGRLFQPFFTTKPVGVGTGLGLYICHHIVTGLQGAIEIDTAEGKGSAFRVVLPPAQARGSVAPEAAPAAQERGRSRILVVDDEPMIGATLRRILSVHEVVTVRSAREAMGRLLSNERFDAILCDLMMPEMSGMELHAQLAGSHPEIARRMVFLTGGIFTESARSFAERIPNAMVEKPFDAAALRALVAKIVGERP